MQFSNEFFLHCVDILVLVDHQVLKARDGLKRARVVGPEGIDCKTDH